MIWDINGTSNILSVCVVTQVVAQQGMRRGFEDPFRDVLNSPRGIFLEGVPCLVGLHLITNLDCACAVFNRGTLLEEEVVIRDNRSEKIVPVEAVP
jgi:hypothetical protein